jgi:hypothetical protein
VPGAHPILYSSMRAPAPAQAASVSAEVIDVRPTARDAAKWWAAVDPDRLDETMTATLAAANQTPRASTPRSSSLQLLSAGFGLLIGLMTAMWRITAPRPPFVTWLPRR